MWWVDPGPAYTRRDDAGNGSGVNDGRTTPGRFVRWISPSSPCRFGAIFVVELPDKTFVAALVLATRYKPWAVWVGVGLAFFVQTLIAVTVGRLVTYCPTPSSRSWPA